MAKSIKRRREVLNIGTKIKIIDMFEAGKRISVVARIFNKNESSIRQILRNRDKIREFAYKYPRKVKIPDTARSNLLFKVEIALTYWLEQMEQQCVNVDKNSIRTKAVELFEQLRSAEPKFSDVNFVASNTWMTRFLKKLKKKATEDEEDKRNVELHSEDDSKSSAEFISNNDVIDCHASKPVVKNLKSVRAEFQEIVASEKYNDRQIFCINETGLYWKRMPSCTVLQKSMEQASKFSYYKDRLTLTLCCNAAGHMIKPGVIYRKKNPCALRKKYKGSLPVFWQSHSKIHVTAALFLDWFHMCFKPEIQEYLSREKLPYKILLVVNEATWHPASLVTENEHVQILFLPPDVALSLQPLNNQIMQHFKANYLRHILNMIHMQHEYADLFDIWQCWQSFSLVDALLFIKQAIDDIPLKCITESWLNLSMNKEQAVDAQLQLENLLQIAKQIPLDGFSQMSKKDLENYLAAHDEELSADDLKQLILNAESDEEQENDEEHNTVPGWTFEKFTTIFHLAHSLQTKITEWDPIMERSMRINKQITQSLAPMQKLFNELKRLQRLQAATERAMEFNMEEVDCNDLLIEL